jgi:tetratricopeptide (TPR) repeat protein/anti-sigma regulatory factor (Ser/Thr protein kinase)
MHRTIWIAYLFLFPYLAFAQIDSFFNIPDDALSWYNKIENTDSLKNLLPYLNARGKVNVLCEIAYSNLGRNADKAFTYATRALLLADSLDYYNGKVMAIMLMAGKGMPGKHDTIRALRTLQKAEKYFDEKTHWTLKYRIWFGIGSRLDRIGKLDSAIYYYKKPLQELDEDEAWLAYFGAYSWLGQYAKLTNDHEAERVSYENSCRLIFEHPEYASIYGKQKALSALEKLPAYYTQHGEYKQSVATCRSILDSISGWNVHQATLLMYQGKFLGKIGRAYHHWGKFDSAIVYHDSAIVYFSKILNEHLADLQTMEYPAMQEWEINMANQLEEKAGVLIKLGRFDQAEADLQQSVKMRAENKDLLGVAMSFDRLGELMAAQGKFTEAIHYYDSALLMKTDFFKGFRQNRGELSASFWTSIVNESISYTLLMKGQLYDDWGKQQISIGFLKQSFGIANEIGYQKGEAEALTALGSVYLNIGINDSALVCFSKARSIYTAIDHSPGLGISHEKLGDYFVATAGINMAMENYTEALRFYDSLEMPRNIAGILNKQAAVFKNRKEWDKALGKYSELLEIADALGLKQLQMDGNSNLSEIYSILRQPELAFDHYKKYIALRDEVYSQETKHQIAEIETRYETEKKEQHILLLETENQLFSDKVWKSRIVQIALGSSILVLVLLVLLYLQRNKLKNQQEKTRLQQKLLRSQMNPHFIFNSLSSVQNAIINNQPAVASRYLSRFSKLMRNILESSASETIGLDEELTTIDNYLALQKVRFPDKFDYTVSVDENIDINSIHIPPMLTQPFIENAIEHGFRLADTTGHIIIRFSLHNNFLNIEVEDDGIGRQKAAELRQKGPKDYKSMATHITRQRVSALNRGKKRKITMDIIDMKDEEGLARGTMVKFGIPV